MEALVKTIDLKKYFKVGDNRYLHAVDGVNLEIPTGQTLGVVGESGCGKSTLGRVIINLLPATSGQVLFDGQNTVGCDKKEYAAVRRAVQMIFQDPYSSLDPRMTLYELIAEPLVMNRACANKHELMRRVMELMEMVGLAERFVNAYPHELDGGRRQRIGVARAMALKPRFVVCDEPVSALDVSIQAQILNLLMDMQDKLKLTFLFITHNLSVVKHISDEIMVMYLGQCVEKATSDGLFRNPLHPYTQALLDAILRPVLGTSKDKRLLRGEVFSPINPEPGCRFAQRCEQSRPECMQRDIPLITRPDGHQVACVLYGS